MNKILIAIATLLLSACAHEVLVPQYIMPTPPAEIMVPGKPLETIQKPQTTKKPATTGGQTNASS